MKVRELVRQLGNSHCPQDAEVVIADERFLSEKDESYLKPEVIWWSDDRETVYLGEL